MNYRHILSSTLSIHAAAAAPTSQSILLAQWSPFAPPTSSIAITSASAGRWRTAAPPEDRAIFPNGKAGRRAASLDEGK